MNDFETVREYLATNYTYVGGRGRSNEAPNAALDRIEALANERWAEFERLTARLAEAEEALVADGCIAQGAETERLREALKEEYAAQDSLRHERDDAEAEVERWKKKWQKDTDALEDERDVAVAEVERLRERVKLLEGMEGGEYASANRLRAEVERLRAELNNAEAAWVAEKDEVERLLTHSENLGTALLESRAEVERLLAALERIEPIQQKTLAMLRREGFKFETRLDLTDGWEKLAFTLYSTICEVDAIARAALAKEEA